MLRECGAHGYFRGEACADCGDEGRFLMSERELDSLGRLMAGALRHFPERLGLEMDKRGWVSLDYFVEAVRKERDRYHWLRPRHIVAVAVTDPKGRYEIQGDKLRATYGHSLDLDMDLPTDHIPTKLYYPVTEEELDIVLERGLQPTDRKMVHLSETYESALAVGLRRTESPIVLGVNADEAIREGLKIMRAGRQVYVVEAVPPQYVSVEK